MVLQRRRHSAEDRIAVGVDGLALLLLALLAARGAIRRLGAPRLLREDPQQRPLRLALRERLALDVVVQVGVFEQPARSAVLRPDPTHHSGLTSVHVLMKLRVVSTNLKGQSDLLTESRRTR